MVNFDTEHEQEESKHSVRNTAVKRTLLLFFLSLLLLGISLNVSNDVARLVFSSLALVAMLSSVALALKNHEKFKRIGLVPAWVKDLPIDDPERRKREREKS